MIPEEILIKKKINYIPTGSDLKIHCLNPDHDDKDPSLLIDKITGIFHCFSCGFKGNIFEFFGQKGNFLTMKRQMLKTKISKKLAENVGLEIPINAISFDQNWRNIEPKTYHQFNAFEHNSKEFIGRVVFPIKSISGKISGFIGRHMTMNQSPKYLITPAGTKLPLFPPNPEIYEGRIILVEGMFDMLNLWDKGLKNAVCVFGTQSLLSKDAKNKLDLYKLRGVVGVDIFFDGDEAGQKAAEVIKGICEQLELDTRNVEVKDKDPGELTASQVIKLREKLYGEYSFS